MEQTLFIAGSSILGFLGTVHLVYTYFTDRLNPKDEAAIDAMKSSHLILTNQTSVWDAWIGFNASHSLGAMLFAAIYIPLCAFHFDVVESSLWFSWLPMVVGISYLLLARRYWFQTPFTGILLASVSFGWAAVLTAT